MLMRSRIHTLLQELDAYDINSALHAGGYDDKYEKVKFSHIATGAYVYKVTYYNDNTEKWEDAFVYVRPVNKDDGFVLIAGY